MNRLFAAFFVVFSCAFAARAEDKPVAALLPADTFFYVEADAGALAEGLPTLDVARLLSNPKYKDFFRPAFDRHGLDPEKPIESLLATLPVRDWLAGKFALGLRGFAVRIVEPDGQESRLVVSPDHPVDSAFFYRLIGTSLRWERQRKMGSIHIQPDLMAVVEPGPRGKEMLRRILAGGESDIESSAVQVGTHSLTRLRLSEKVDGPIHMDLDVYADLSGDRWILATDPEACVQAIEGGPRASLAGSPRCAAVRTRMTGGRSALFVYADLAAGLKMAERFVPPILAESLDMSGLASLRGLGFGLSFSEGGVRESVGIVLDGEPKGFWRLLDAMPGGMRSLEMAPPDAVMVLGAKFDMKIFVERIEELVRTFVPGNEDFVRETISRGLEGSGLDFDKDLLPAFGDEVGLVLFKPMGLGIPVPGWMLGVKLRDEAAFSRVLEVLKRSLANEAGGTVQFAPLKLETPGGPIDAFQVLAPIPMQPPVFAIHGGHLVGASDKDLLMSALARNAGEAGKTLARDGEVFGKVLKGLTGGESGNLVVLSYVDLRGIVPVALTYGMGVIPPGFVDRAHTPDYGELAGHLSGVAIALRRDGDGVTLDLFSPVGAILPGAAVAIAHEVRRQEEFERAMREWEEQRQINEQAERDDAAFLGINFELAGEELIVGSAIEGTAAAKAGIQAGDRILRIGDQDIRQAFDLRRVLVTKRPSDKVTLRVLREGQEMDVEVTLGRRGDFVDR